MSPLDDNTHSVLTDDGAGADVSRRLSDKILSAFNHAYAVGELEIAAKLKGALKANESRGGGKSENRTEYDPLGQADMWVSFVEARDQYKSINAAASADPSAVATVLEEMKDAYRRWSMS